LEHFLVLFLYFSFFCVLFLFVRLSVYYYLYSTDFSFRLFRLGISVSHLKLN